MFDFIYFVLITNILFCSYCVAFAQMPIHALVFLILTYINGSLLLFLLGFEFLAIILILVYVGAIMILFTFTLMMVTVTIKSFQLIQFKGNKSIWYTLNFLLGLFIFFYYFLLLEDLKITVQENKKDQVFFSKESDILSQYLLGNELKTLGIWLYGTPLNLFVLILGIFFFVVVVGAIAVVIDFKYNRKKKEGGGL